MQKANAQPYYFYVRNDFFGGRLIHFDQYQTSHKQPMNNAQWQRFINIENDQIVISITFVLAVSSSGAYTRGMLWDNQYIVMMMIAVICNIPNQHLP